MKKIIRRTRNNRKGSEFSPDSLLNKDYTQSSIKYEEKAKVHFLINFVKCCNDWNTTVIYQLVHNCINDRNFGIFNICNHQEFKELKLLEYHLKNRQEVEGFVRNEVLTTSEAAKLLDVSRQRMSQLISSGKLTPVKKLRGESLFIRYDVEQKRKELEEARKKYRPYDN